MSITVGTAQETVICLLLLAQIFLSDKRLYRPGQDVWCADTRIVSGGYSRRNLGTENDPRGALSFRSWILFSGIVLFLNLNRSYSHFKSARGFHQSGAKTLHFCAGPRGQPLISLPKIVLSPGGDAGIRIGISSFFEAFKK